MGDARLPSASAVDAIDAPSQAAHTPGPWLVWSSLYEGMKAAVVNNEGEHLRTIAEVRQSYADAMLIAAAPALLGLLEEAMDSRAPDLADAAHKGWSERARNVMAALGRSTADAAAKRAYGQNSNLGDPR